MSAFFCKKLAFFVLKNIFTQSNGMRAALEVLLVLFSVFVRQKVAITENITLADSVSKIGPPDCSKLAKNPRNDNEVIIFRQTSTSNFFDVLLFLLSNLVTGPSFMSISSLVLEL